MATYNIYGNDNANDNPPVLATVVLDDSTSEIISITSEDPKIQKDANSVIREYMDGGMPALDALSRYAGSYGDVKAVGSDGGVVAAGEVEEVEPAEVVEAPNLDGLMAMVNDDGTVITLLKRDPESGAVIRHDGEWIPLNDPSTLDGLNFVGVVDGAVELYDQHEANGSLVPIQHYPASEDGPFWPIPTVEENLVLDEETGEYYDPNETEDVDDEEEGDAITAAVTINKPKDLEAAIVAATLNPDLRWYVERRVAALGLEASLPWQKG